MKPNLPSAPGFYFVKLKTKKDSEYNLGVVRVVLSNNQLSVLVDAIAIKHLNGFPLELSLLSINDDIFEDALWSEEILVPA